MRPRATIASLCAGVMAIATTAWLAAAGRPESPAVFTAEQAAAGKTAYARSCASCHLADLSGGEVPPLGGAGFTSAWGARSTKELLEYIAASMPPDGSALSPSSYVDVTAYILQFNGAVAGSEPLTASTALPIASLLPPDAPR